VVVVVGEATGLRIEALLRVADGVQLTTGLTEPAHPAILIEVVCPPVISEIPPINEVVPHMTLYAATLEFDGPWVSMEKVYGGEVGAGMVMVLFEPVA
jgi:hypothetical protein